MMTKQKAESLGLTVYRLLTLDAGGIRRLPPEQANLAVLYGLDGPQNAKLVRKEQATPEIVMLHQGVPIRPLYLNHTTGKVMRAVPIDWDWGVDYIDLRKAAPQLL